MLRSIPVYRWLFTSLALLLSASAQAKDYQVELIVFQNLATDSGGSPTLYYPKLHRSLGLGSDRAAAEGFQLIDPPPALTAEAQAIAGSRGFRVLRHIAWRQPGLDARNAREVRIYIGKVFDVFVADEDTGSPAFVPAMTQPGPGYTNSARAATISGSVQVTLGRYLHLESKLVWNDPEAQQSWRLFQSRRMRSRELHYIDNPKFGILAWIVPIEDGAS